MRIVSHTCSNTEIICALGLSDYLVGVDEHSDYPSGVVEKLPKIGPDLNIDINKIKALKPDLVVTSLTVPGHEQGLERLREAGLPLLVTDPRTLEDVATDMARIGAALGMAARGDALAAEFRARLDALAQSHAQPLPVLVEWWPKPVIVPGRDSWVTQLLPLAGAYNPWGEHPVKSFIVDTDAVQHASPQAVIMSWCGVSADKYRAHVVSRRPGWQTVPAVAQGQIHALSEAYLGRPGPRLVDGLERLRQIMERVRIQAAS